MVSFYLARTSKAFIDKLAGQRGETKADTYRAMLAYAQANMPKRWRPSEPRRLGKEQP